MKFINNGVTITFEEDYLYHVRGAEDAKQAAHELREFMLQMDVIDKFTPVSVELLDEKTGHYREVA